MWPPVFVIQIAIIIRTFFFYQRWTWKALLLDFEMKLNLQSIFLDHGKNWGGTFPEQSSC